MSLPVNDGLISKLIQAAAPKPSVAVMAAAFDLPLLNFRPNTIVYSAAMAVDLSKGSWQLITATDTNAFTIANPTNVAGLQGPCFALTIANASGGTIGTWTFGTAYKVEASPTKPANGFQRTYLFVNDGTNWREWSYTANDVAN
jgi:hypothetical protein